MTIRLGAYCFFLLFFAHAIVWTQNLDGIWYARETSHEEYLGVYEYISELTIENGRYILMHERISERAMYWSSGEKGTLGISNSEITFSKEEQAYGQWDLHWESEQEISIYTFFLKNDFLIIDLFSNCPKYAIQN